MMLTCSTLMINKFLLLLTCITGTSLTIVSGGPKNYTYRTNTGKVKMKIRGITRKVINFDVMQELVYKHAIENEKCKVVVPIPYKITREKKTKEIVTKRMKKTIALFITNV